MSMDVQQATTVKQTKGFSIFRLDHGLVCGDTVDQQCRINEDLTTGSIYLRRGTLLFPVSYIFGDILTEVYGYGRSRRVIWMGFFCAALMVVTLVFRVASPANGRGMTPRIVLASLVAYWAGRIRNSYTLARMKILTKGRWLWDSNDWQYHCGRRDSTALLFVSIAFAGNLPGDLSLVEHCSV